VPRGARTDTRVDTAVAAGCVLVALALLVLPDSARARVAGAIRGTIVAPLVATQQRAGLARRAFVEHDSLVRIADSIVQRSQRLDDVAAENARLRGLLGLGRALGWGFVPAEALVGRGMGDDHSLVLSAGRSAGVERLSAVVAPDGLVGMVQDVDEHTSVAITWPSPEFRVSVTSADGSAFGIVAAYDGPGETSYLLELRGVPFRAQIRPGTPIVSSGLGGIYPRGILVGTVLQQLDATSGWTRTYLVRPAVRPADVTSVMILSPERNAEGVESVWRPGVEALTRRLSSAADSLSQRARDSSAAIARKRALDSLAVITPQAGSAAVSPAERPPR